MGYEILDPFPPKGYMAELRLWQRRTEWESATRTDIAESTSAMDAAVLAELRYREEGFQRPVFIGGKWMAIVRRQWCQVDPPADAPVELRVGMGIA